MIQPWHETAARQTFRRMEAELRGILGEGERFSAFSARFADEGPRLLSAFHALYGWTYDFYHHLRELILLAARTAAERPDALVGLDAERQARLDWFQDHRALGAVLYVDRFAGDLDGIRGRIPYLKALGITYLHLMPLFAVPEGENDGGYAVSDYRRVDPRLGSMAGLSDLARELRAEGISLVLDFILNHTSDEHPWALAAKAGDEEAQALYWMFDDRRQPDRFQPYLRAIFPDRGGDSFTWRPDVPGPHGGRWVWTTFYTFQWDLNYRNPALLTAIAGELLFLANQGVEVLRLDAVPFLWKEPGTNCENRPEAHTVVQVLNAVAAIAAPALVFKSEAIVHPDEVVRFVSREECRLSYNPLAMALCWEALATGEVRLLKDALARRHALPGGTAWINYLRCHDDIGWGFADEDARRLGIDPAAHRSFLNAFYTGRFPGSFAAGLPFQENPETGDCRICGTLASLAGLERAKATGDAEAVGRAVRRIVMLHGLILTFGGIPLLYLGDEIAVGNDYGFRDEPAHAADARWVHRPVFPWDTLDTDGRPPADTPEAAVNAGLRRLIDLRGSTPALAGGTLSVVELHHPSVLAFLREGAGGRVVVVASFSGEVTEIGDGPVFGCLGREDAVDRTTGRTWWRQGAVRLDPYAFHVFAEAERPKALGGR